MNNHVQLLVTGLFQVVESDLDCLIDHLCFNEV